MRPVVGTATLLLLVLMFMSASATWDPKQTCETKYPAIPCRHKINNENWFQMGDNRCVKAKTCNKYSHGNYKGHLVSIHNNVELHQAVCTMYRDHPGKDHYWIGLHMKIEHIFYGYAYVWTDGTDNSFTSWAYRQPDRFLSREECVEMNYWDWTLWNDERCGQQRSYMCAVWIG
ncbi:C-type lectin BpLec-like isoform X1 [Siniperca chuatsi]|uniref:C-type lectin BpLec-like isoform X1 n=1 Tax=Siniperca chuatsi TaxID=119488 RepID=UPI001CE08C23|nr:C-type lectin BpLec-like isoform X1 [Siniperca chuatsi]XP_044059148.1 C-type lectin BpLec-like isoform X1 [Siniperca chuatsi]XP_044059159.1 C-type lectin BpLec-like isoform X1 [Siniperca chuatsi]